MRRISKTSSLVLGPFALLACQAGERVTVGELGGVGADAAAAEAGRSGAGNGADAVHAGAGGSGSDVMGRAGNADGTAGQQPGTGGSPTASGGYGGAQILDAGQHFELARLSPIVQAIAVARREDDSIVALAEEGDESAARISLRQVHLDQGSPSFGVVWASLSLPSGTHIDHLSVAPLDRGVAIAYRGTSAGASTGVQGFVRFAEDGTLISGPEDDALPPRSSANAGCDVVADASRVLLACSAAHITLASCAGSEACSEALVLDAVPRPVGPPALIVDADRIQLVYETGASPATLHRVFVDKGALEVLSEQDLATLPDDTELPPTAPRALPLEAGLLVAYGVPRQFGVWDEEGQLLRSSAPGDLGTERAGNSDWSAFWVYDRTYGGIALGEGGIDVVETTHVGQLDVNKRIAQILRLDPDTLELTDSLTLSDPAVLVTDASPAVVLWMDVETGLLMAPLAKGPLGSLEASSPLVGRRSVAPLGVGCDAQDCTVLARAPAWNGSGDSYALGLWSIDRKSGVSREPTDTVDDNSSGRLLCMGVKQALVAVGAEEASTLTEFGSPSDEPASTDLPSQDVLGAFSEGGQLRIWSRSPQGAIDSTLVDSTQPGELTPANTTFAADARLCGDRAIAVVDEGSKGRGVYALDAADTPATTEIGRIAPEPKLTGDWSCTEHALFVLSENWVQVDDTSELLSTIQVLGLDGTLRWSVAGPGRCRRLSIGAAAAKFWVLWAMDTDDSRLMLTSTDEAGETSLYALSVAEGLRTGQTRTYAAPLSIAGGELSVAWVTEDAKPVVSVWALPWTTAERNAPEPGSGLDPGFNP
jgi:hypothetical protein